MKELVSILIPTCNRPRYFEQALTSALLQTYSNIEIVVCDNSDNGRTEQVVQRYRSNFPAANITYVRNAVNQGPIVNQHQCFDLASGKYINYLMDDDLLHPEKIKRMVDVLESQPGVSLVTSRRKIIDPSGRTIRKAPEEKPFRKFEREAVRFDRNRLMVMMLRDQMNYIGEPTAALFRREDLSEPFGAWRGRQAYNNVDVASWFSLLRRGDAVMLKKPLSLIRRHPQQLSKTTLSKMGRLCDWLDHTLEAHRCGVFTSSSDLKHTVGRLHEDLMSRTLRWNRETNAVYTAEWVLRIRRLRDLCRDERKLSSLVKDFETLLERLERQQRQTQKNQGLSFA